jgi:hypothetical protein
MLIPEDYLQLCGLKIIKSSSAASVIGTQLTSLENSFRSFQFPCQYVYGRLQRPPYLNILNHKVMSTLLQPFVSITHLNLAFCTCCSHAMRFNLAVCLPPLCHYQAPSAFTIFREFPAAIFHPCEGLPAHVLLLVHETVKW